MSGMSPRPVMNLHCHSRKALLIQQSLMTIYIVHVVDVILNKVLRVGDPDKLIGMEAEHFERLY